MSKTLLYLVGAPAAGKTTLMAALTRACDRRPAAVGTVRYDILSRGGADVAVELGTRRDQFSGTDALPMQVQPAAVDWIRRGPAPLVLGEGDRLANIGFFVAADAAGYVLQLVVVETPQPILDARAHARPRRQDPRWRAGRATKVRRLAALADALAIPCHHVDGTADTDSTVQTLIASLPALTPLGTP